MTQVVIMICAMAIYLHDEGVGFGVGLNPGEATGATLGLMAACWAMGQAVIYQCGRTLDRTGSYRAVMRAEQAGAWVRFGSAAAFAWAVLAGGWLEAVRRAFGDLIAIDEVVALAPFATVISMTWWSLYPIERRVREAALLCDLDRGEPVYPIAGRWSHVFGCVRHQLMLTLLPLVIVMAWVESVDRAATMGPEWMRGALADSGLKTGVTLLGVLTVFVIAPLGLRVIWDTVPLAAGPARERVMGVCRRHGVRIRNVLVWRTHGVMTNAAVMGVLPGIRYVLLTDSLLDQLSEDEVEAVAAHEVGHAKHRHILWLAGGLVGLLTVMTILVALLAEVLLGGAAREDWSESATAIGAVALSFWAFGFVSRRFEWQADAFAAQDLSGMATSAAIAPRIGPVVVTSGAVQAMVGALDKVARLNGVAVNRNSWRHGSIRARQQRLLALVGRNVTELPIDATVGWLKGLIFILCGMAIGVFVAAG